MQQFISDELVFIVYGAWQKRRLDLVICSHYKVICSRYKVTGETWSDMWL